MPTEPPAKPKHAGGAPTAYKPEYCETLIEYFERDRPAREVTRVITSDPGGNSGNGMLKRETRYICAELPTFEGFAKEIGVSSFTLREWGNRHPEFSTARARAKDIQFQFLTDRMLTEQYNPQAAIFVAKNITWMKDRQELTGADGGPLTLQAVPSALAALPDEKLRQIQQWCLEQEAQKQLTAAEEQQ